MTLKFPFENLSGIIQTLQYSSSFISINYWPLSQAQQMPLINRNAQPVNQKKTVESYSNSAVLGVFK